MKSIEQEISRTEPQPHFYSPYSTFNSEMKNPEQCCFFGNVVVDGWGQEDLPAHVRQEKTARKMIALINRGFYQRAIRYSIDSLRGMGQIESSWGVEVYKLKAMAQVLIGKLEEAEFSLREAYHGLNRLDEKEAEGLEMPPSILGLLVDNRLREWVDNPKVRKGFRKAVSTYLEYILSEVEEGWA